MPCIYQWMVFMPGNLPCSGVIYIAMHSCGNYMRHILVNPISFCMHVHSRDFQLTVTNSLSFSLLPPFSLLSLSLSLPLPSLPPSTFPLLLYSLLPSPLSHRMEWKETARWIKFEEDVEEGGDKWSKPHVATLSLHSLFELRSCMMKGTVLLDLEATNLAQISGL